MSTMFTHTYLPPEYKFPNYPNGFSHGGCLFFPNLNLEWKQFRTSHIHEIQAKIPYHTKQPKEGCIIPIKILWIWNRILFCADSEYKKGIKMENLDEFILYLNMNFPAYYCTIGIILLLAITNQEWQRCAFFLIRISFGSLRVLK